MQFSSLKTLSFGIVKKLVYIAFLHLSQKRSDMGVKLSTFHLFSGLVEVGPLASCPGSFEKKGVSRFFASEAQPLLHQLCSFLSHHYVHIHCVQILWSRVEVEFPWTLFLGLPVIEGRWVPWVLAIAPFIQRKLFWSLIAHLYHLSRVVGGSWSIRMFFWRGMGKVSRKYSITALFFANLDLVMSILNFATCSLIEEFPIFISFIL